MLLFRFLTICHNLLGLHHVAEFKLASGSLASAFLTKPAGFQDLRAAFFRLWETWVSADWEGKAVSETTNSSSRQTSPAPSAVGTSWAAVQGHFQSRLGQSNGITVFTANTKALWAFKWMLGRRRKLWYLHKRRIQWCCLWNYLQNCQQF